MDARTKGLPSYIGGRRLLNAAGDIDPASAGFQYAIDTLSYIRSSVIEQKFYEIPFSDFIPVDVGEGAYSDEVVQNLTFMSGGSFHDGDMANSDNTGRFASVETGLDPIRMPTRLWGKQAGWNIFEIARAAAASNWDVVESKLKSLKKDWDLGIQEVAFLGAPGTSITGLLNNSNVTVNTSLISTPLRSMNETQFTAFVGGLLPAYFDNSNDTSLPDTFLIPNSDYLGLGVPYSATYPNISKLQYLLETLRRLTGNPNFEVKGLSYAQSNRNAGAGISQNRYVLYKNDPETLKMAIPVDFTMLEADTSDKFLWVQKSVAQYSGVLINREPEVLYIDET